LYDEECAASSEEGDYFISNLDAIFNEWNHHVVETIASLVSILSDCGVETIEILTLELILGFWNHCIGDNSVPAAPEVWFSETHMSHLLLWLGNTF